MTRCVGNDKTAVVGCEVAISNINCDALLTLSHKTVKQKRIVNVTAATADLTVKLKSLFLIGINKLCVIKYVTYEC